jgi:hypothetical protein
MDVNVDSKKNNAPARQDSVQWRSYLLFTLCASLYLLPFMRIIFAGTDEGILLCGAERIVHGQVFARDFFEMPGPGTFYWLAAFFKLFGVTFLASRICLFISSLGIALSYYFLTCRICSSYRVLPSLILVATLYGGTWPGISHHTDSTFFALLAIICMVLWNDAPRNSLVTATGLLAGITTCIHQPKGALLLCAFLVWLWFQRRKTSTPLLAATLLTGGYFTVVALVLSYFWSQGALGSLYYANVVFPRLDYGTVNSIPYAFGILIHYWTPWTKAGLPAAIAAILIIPFLFVAVLPALIFLVGIRYKWKSITPEVALYWLCGWALWIAEIHRKDIEHLVFGSPLLILLCIYALTQSRRKIASIALQILAITAVCLAGFNCCTVLFMGATPITTRVGKMGVNGSAPVIRFMNEQIAPGEEVLVYPYSPGYYFLSGTTNPARYSSLTYNMNTPAQFQDVVSVLDRRRVKWVVWDTTLMFHQMADNFPGSRPKSPDGYIVEPYLESHYKLVVDYKGIHIMERKSEKEIEAIGPPLR